MVPNVGAANATTTFELWRDDYITTLLIQQIGEAKSSQSLTDLYQRQKDNIHELQIYEIYQQKLTEITDSEKISLLNEKDSLLKQIELSSTAEDLIRIYEAN